MLTVIFASNPVYANAEQTAINLDVVFQQYPDQVMPFTASENDSTEYGRELFAKANQNLFGIVQPYVPASNPTETVVTGAQNL